MGKWLKKNIRGHQILRAIMATAAAQAIGNDENSELFKTFFISLASLVDSNLKEDDRLDIDLFDSLNQLLNGSEYRYLLTQPQGLSDIFETYCVNERKLATANVQQADKNISTVDQALFSQIFTPPPVVRAIIQQTLSPRINACQSIEELKQITLLDPCCGTGNFLSQAMAEFFTAYTDFGATDVCQLIVDNNIVGLDIDKRTLAIAALILNVQSLKLSGKLVVASCLYNTAEGDEAALGSLAPGWSRQKGHPLSRKYQVIVTNPPYLGRKLIDRALKLKLKKHFPQCANDVSLAFLWKALDLVAPEGTVGFLTQSACLHLASARELRERILRHKLKLIVEIGSGVFPLLPGEKADNSIIVVEAKKSNDISQASYIDISSSQEKMELLSDLTLLPTIHKSHKELSASPDLAFNFKRPQALAKIQTMRLMADQADFKQGLATSCNERFLRYAWEVQGNSDYVPYAKGGGSERWWRTITSRVLWADNGAEIKAAVAESYPYLKGKVHWVVKNEAFYFKPGLTFSFVSTSRLSVRKLPAGAIFDVGGSAIFAQNQTEEDCLLAFLNSSLASALAHDLNPTINFQVGDLKRLPILDLNQDERNRLSDLTQEAIAIKQTLEPLISLPAALINGTPAFDLSNGGYEKYSAIVETCQSRLNEIEDTIDDLVLKIVARNCLLDKDDERALRHWVSEIMVANAPVSASKNITASIFFENQLVSNFAALESSKLELHKDLTIDDVAQYLNQRHKPISIEVDFARKFCGADLKRYFCGRFNRVSHEQFGGQPPVLATAGSVQATRPLLKDATDTGRAADLYRSLLPLPVVCLD